MNDFSKRVDALSPAKRRLLEMRLREKGQERVAARPRTLRPNLIPLQAGGTNPPFFCVHPILGTVFPYYELTRRLGTDQPFYGLQSVGLFGEEPFRKTVEEMADNYIEAIRGVQPHGPYHIGGWSFGSLVAYEIARRLHLQGEKVKMLALVDTPAPGAIGVIENFKFFSSIVRHIWPFVRDYFRLVKSFAGSSVGGRKPSGQPSRTKPSAFPAVRPMMEAFRANATATGRYRPEPYPGRVLLFRSIDRKGGKQGATMGWEKLARGGVDLVMVPGDHMTLLRPPNVEVLAEKLKAHLEQADVANN